jgi:hypothetical protein
MATRKTAKPIAKKKAVKKPQRPIIALYGIPIYNAIRRGNPAEMKQLAAQARKHINEVSKALAALEKKIGK